MLDEILLYVAIGFAAQMVDGAIGMAYGVTATSVLLGVGMPPAVASACVHAAESVTTGASGLCHWRLGNIDRRLLVRLALPGMIGGIVGAMVVSHVPGDRVRPFINAYLLALGLVILWRALRQRRPACAALRLTPLGLGGGFLDAIGGGGWGAIVTTSLLNNGLTARHVIGSVNGAEFFVTVAVSIAFASVIGLTHWPVIVGLIGGGVLAAPFAALVTRHLPERALMALVGCVVTLLSARGLVLTLT